MHKNLQGIIVIFAIVYIAFSMRGVFSGSAPAIATRNASNAYIDVTGKEVSLYSGNYLWVDNAKAAVYLTPAKSQIF